MNTPPGLLGLALAFWGWQTGLLLFAVPMALGLEVSRLVAWRWELTTADARRVADLCRVILVAMAVSLGATRGPARVVLGLIEWFPLAVLPLLVCQAYGTGDRIDLRTFFLILRRRRANDGETVNLAYPYLVICIGAASAANVRTPAFFVGVCGLAAWALWPTRPRAFAWPVWAGTLALAAGAGYVGHVGLHELRGVVVSTVSDWVFDYYTGWEQDPFRRWTSLGSIGQLKLSDRIVLRVAPDTPPASGDGPLLLHEAAYDVYTASVWGAVDTTFEPVPPQPDRKTWDLVPDAPPGQAAREVMVSAYTKRGRGMVVLPNGAFRIEELPASQMKRNRLGAVKVEDGLRLATYRVRFAPAVSPASAPSDTDLKIPPQEALVITRIATELSLAGRPPRESLETVAGYFRSNFRYSTYLEGTRGGMTALEDFFLRTHAGHCEYFATATVLLLRAAGIPTRYATGYSVQEWSPREGRYLVRGRHRHAWALAWVDGGWRDVDTTPPVWASAEMEGASVWEPLYDLASWAMFLVSSWRWSDQDLTYVRFAVWLLVPLFGVVGWRLYRRRRVSRAATAGVVKAPCAVRPGEDSEFYLIERRLEALGLGRRPWEPVLSWLDRVRATSVEGVRTVELAAAATLHYRYRFDPKGLPPEERDALRANVRAWLNQHPAARD